MIFWPETAKSGTWGNSIKNKLPRNGSAVLQYDITFFLLHFDSPSKRHVGYKWLLPRPNGALSTKFIALVSLSFLQIIMVHWTPSRVMKRNSMDNKPSHQNSCNSNPSKHPFDTISWCTRGTSNSCRSWSRDVSISVISAWSPEMRLPLLALDNNWSLIVTSNWATHVRFCIKYGFAEAIR